MPAPLPAPIGRRLTKRLDYTCITNRMSRKKARRLRIGAKFFVTPGNFSLVPIYDLGNNESFTAFGFEARSRGGGSNRPDTGRSTAMPRISEEARQIAQQLFEAHGVAAPDVAKAARARARGSFWSREARLWRAVIRRTHWLVLRHKWESFSK